MYKSLMLLAFMFLASSAHAQIVSVSFKYSPIDSPFHDYSALDNAVVAGTFLFKETGDTGFSIFDHPIISASVSIDGVNVPINNTFGGSRETRIRVFEDDIAPFDRISVSLLSDFLYNGIQINAFGLTFTTDFGDEGISSTGLNRNMFDGFSRPFGRVIFDDPLTSEFEQFDNTSRSLDGFQVTLVPELDGPILLQLGFVLSALYLGLIGRRDEQPHLSGPD